MKNCHVSKMRNMKEYIDLEYLHVFHLLFCKSVLSELRIEFILSKEIKNLEWNHLQIEKSLL